jgi:hypothetical protein
VCGVCGCCTVGSCCNEQFKLPQRFGRYIGGYIVYFKAGNLPIKSVTQKKFRNMYSDFVKKKTEAKFNNNNYNDKTTLCTSKLLSNVHTNYVVLSTANYVD